MVVDVVPAQFEMTVRGPIVNQRGWLSQVVPKHGLDYHVIPDAFALDGVVEESRIPGQENVVVGQTDDLFLVHHVPGAVGCAADRIEQKVFEQVALEELFDVTARGGRVEYGENLPCLAEVPEVVGHAAALNAARDVVGMQHKLRHIRSEEHTSELQSRQYL